MAIHQQHISAYVETEIPEGMTLGAYRVRNVNREQRRHKFVTRPVSLEEARRIIAKDRGRHA